MPLSNLSSGASPSFNCPQNKEGGGMAALGPDHNWGFAQEINL